MADGYSMGLMGQNNPILQASQLQSQQSAQMRNMAAEGIINKTMQTEAKKLGAELDMLTKLATEGQSPATVNSAFKRLGDLLNTDFSDVMVDEDAITELKDIRKLMNDKSGNFLPDKVTALFDDYVSRRGRRFISKEEEEGFQESQKQGYLSQGLAAQRQIQATPGLTKSPEAMEYAQAETDRLLTSGGTKGAEIAGRKDEGETDKDVNEFQTFKQSYLQKNPNATGMELVTAFKDSTRQRETYADTQILGRLVDRYNADPAIRKVEQMDQFSSLITDSALSDNPIAHSSIPTLMARASGEVGNLSEADKAPFGGSRAILARMEQVFTEMASGKRTPDNIKYITGLADIFRNAGERKKIVLARERSKQYAKAYRGKFSEEEIFTMLAPGSEFVAPASDKGGKSKLKSKYGLE